MCVLFDGVNAYPTIISKHEFVLYLDKNIKTIRAARYETKENGTLISGSIENMKQSTQLSKYISSLANHKANYNSVLIKLQFYKTSKLFNIIWNGLFIDSRIMELKPIE